MPALPCSEPWEVKVDMGKWRGHFGTLTPFLAACEALGRLPAPLPAPARLPVAPEASAAVFRGLPLASLGLAAMPRRKDGSIGECGCGWWWWCLLGVCS